MATDTLKLARSGDCDDCTAEDEVIPAAYVLPDGRLVCDTHLEIHVEEGTA